MVVRVDLGRRRPSSWRRRPSKATYAAPARPGGPIAAATRRGRRAFGMRRSRRRPGATGRAPSPSEQRRRDRPSPDPRVASCARTSHGRPARAPLLDLSRRLEAEDHPISAGSAPGRRILSRLKMMRMHRLHAAPPHSAIRGREVQPVHDGAKPGRPSASLSGSDVEAETGARRGAAAVAVAPISRRRDEDVVARAMRLAARVPDARSTPPTCAGRRVRSRRGSSRELGLPLPCEPEGRCLPPLTPIVSPPVRATLDPERRPARKKNRHAGSRRRKASMWRT